MSEVDFKSFHENYYNQLKKQNPEKKICIMCFDDRNMKEDSVLCDDCIYIKKMLEEIKKVN